MFKIAKNKDPKLCCAYRCKNKRAAKDRFCPKHRWRHFKFHNPVKYAYFTLRSNASRRGKDFSLTFEEFVEFCKSTGYIEKKGKTALSASIDRIDPNLGYSADNIQILSLSENGFKKDDCPF